MEAMNAKARLDEIMVDVRGRGVRVWVENGRLHCRSPRGAITRGEIEEIRTLADQIASIREGGVREESVWHGWKGIDTLNCAPLSFAQLQHWNLYQLNERSALRHLVSATRLSGQINVQAMRESFAEVVRQQSSLRTRIVVHGKSPIQEIDLSGDWRLIETDLSEVPVGEIENEVMAQINRMVLEPIDVAVGPLFEAKLLKLGSGEHVLVVVMEHIISDEWSMTIFLQEMFQAYAQIERGLPASLPEVSVQYSDYATWQESMHKSWLEKHGSYWSNRLAGCGRLVFPVDNDALSKGRSGWTIVKVEICGDLHTQLREWCRLNGTTIVMAVFAAYLALVFRWCKASDTVIRYESNGRTSASMERTIGYFTSPLYLRLQLFHGDTLIDLLARATLEYCAAFEHSDSSYMEAQMPRPEFARNTAFNWIPKGLKKVNPELETLRNPIKCREIFMENPRLRDLERDTEPFTVFFDTDEGIVAGVWFPLDRFSVETMDRFARSFLVMIDTLLNEPNRRVCDVALP